MARLVPVRPAGRARRRRRCAAGGAGQQADAALDAVVAVFEHAADLAERLPGAGVRAFVDDVLDRVISDGRPPAGTRRRGGRGAVRTRRQGSGVGRGLRDRRDRRPLADPARSRPSLLGVPGAPSTPQPGCPRPVDRRARSLLDDERRLFYVAATRARRRADRHRSQRPGHCAFPFPRRARGDRRPGRRTRTRWGRPATVGRCISRTWSLICGLTVTDPAAAAVDRDAPPQHLARLARSGRAGRPSERVVRAGRPQHRAPPAPAGRAVAVSPSAVEASLTCGLRGVLERRAGAAEPTQPQIEGIVVHALSRRPRRGLDRRRRWRRHVDEHLAGPEPPAAVAGRAEPAGAARDG